MKDEGRKQQAEEGDDFTMDKLETYRQIIEQLLNEYAQIPYAYGDVDSKVISDRENDQIQRFLR